MFKFHAFAVLVAVSLIVAVTSEYEPKLPFSFQMTTIDTIIGHGVKDARILDNSAYYQKNCGEASCDYTAKYVFPTESTREVFLNQAISKIIVLVEKKLEGETVEVKVTQGGIGEQNIELEIDVKNAQRLNYRVLAFGPTVE